MGKWLININKPQNSWTILLATLINHFSILHITRRHWWFIFLRSLPQDGKAPRTRPLSMQGAWEPSQARSSCWTSRNINIRFHAMNEQNLTHLTIKKYVWQKSMQHLSKSNQLCIRMPWHPLQILCRLQSILISTVGRDESASPRRPFPVVISNKMAGLPVVFLWKQDLLVIGHGHPAWVSTSQIYIFSSKSPLPTSSKPSSFYILIVLTCPYHSYHSNITLSIVILRFLILPDSSTRGAN